MRENDDMTTTTPTDAILEPEAAEAQSLRGVRFIQKYEERSHIHRLHPKRMWRLIVGLGLLLFGLFNAFFVPGPGGSAFVLAALLVLAGESKLLAKLLDYCEVRFARQVDWALRHKIAAALIVSACAATVSLSAIWILSQVR